MRALMQWGAGLLMAGWALGAGAGELKRVDDPARTALQCLVQGSGPGALDLGDVSELKSAFVRVQLRFTAADQPPAVEVIFKSGSEALVQRVLTHVAGYRLPCWTAQVGEVAAVQEFSLEGGKSELWPLEAPAEKKAPSKEGSPESCIKSFPFNLSSRESDQLPADQVLNLKAELTFDGKRGEKPKVVVKSLTAPRAIVRAVQATVEDLKLDCDQSAPVTYQQWFLIMPPGHVPVVFNKALSLQSLLNATTKKSAGSVHFDLGSMACPFSVKLQFQQPLSANVIREIGPTNPNRAALLDWLQKLELAMKPADLEYYLGVEALVDIPCGQLDLRS